MSIRFSIFFCLMVLVQFGFTQESIAELLEEYNDNSVPYISVEELKQEQDHFILDAREKPEFLISHLKGAIHVGYDRFDMDRITILIPNKDQRIVVYCSIGIRSEDIAEKLLKEGYTNVYNLFGGIFEWKNNNNAIFDLQNEETEKIHAFSESWGKWLLKGEKVYD
ncbi:MAG: rhodanese-like domain-containing protein [Bacteroidia bacterium]|nr:rhodanese-like domain-containing protein [Bacteroidia bacterium]MBT8279567.1 rhodanese-like domain-containing protein [Bacteroidia bacterium]NND25385.1 rhodanese-like domain-containing protein [Flavobacteriaceae bacterium]NNK60278.1 rhodanese-like domain-containing protein [Flavobacteriaceae bacterium]NNL34086.1 rhodanese-like domain-containing protein [Flavobacteriaceae bacterium]